MYIYTYISITYINKYVSVSAMETKSTRALLITHKSLFWGCYTDQGPIESSHACSLYTWLSKNPSNPSTSLRVTQIFIESSQTRLLLCPLCFCLLLVLFHTRTHTLTCGMSFAPIAWSCLNPSWTPIVLASRELVWGLSSHALFQTECAGESGGGVGEISCAGLEVNSARDRPI